MQNLRSRRTLLQALAISPAAAALRAGGSMPQFAYAGSGESALQVFRVEGKRWRPIQCIASLHPAFVLLNPNQSVLYVANRIEQHEGLPTSTVEAYGIDGSSGRLTLLNRQPLSLSATLANHLAIAPDAQHLAVAAYGGGIYNVLPIAADGKVQRPIGITKAVGAGSHPKYQRSAHPHTLLFSNDGSHLLSTDFGGDCLSVFRLEDGKLVRSSRVTLDTGTGPSQMLLHPNGSLLYVLHALQGGVSCYRFSQRSGQLESLATSFEGPGRDAGLHPSGQILYGFSQVASGASLVAWDVNAFTGALRRIDSLRLRGIDPGSLQIASDGGRLLFTDRKRGSLLSVQLSSDGAFVDSPVIHASVEAPLSFALKYS